MRPCVLFFLLSVCAIVSDASARACINGEQPPPDPNLIHHRELYSAGVEPVFDTEFRPRQYAYPEYLEGWASDEAWQAQLQMLDQKIAADPQRSVDLRNNRGVALLFLGRKAEALAVFQELEKEQPGAYNNAANLGTTYELMGQNALALYWIAEGLKRNPDSHQGTEWLHVKILETKLALERDPHLLEKHSVLGINFGVKGRPIRPQDLSEEEQRKSIVALQHQLHERMRFVKAPDPIVGDLLFDLANFAALDGWPKQAHDLYQMAIDYHAPAAALASERRSHYSGTAGRTNLELAQASAARSPWNWLLLLGILAYGVRRMFWT